MGDGLFDACVCICSQWHARAKVWRWELDDLTHWGRTTPAHLLTFAPLGSTNT